MFNEQPLVRFKVLNPSYRSAEAIVTISFKAKWKVLFLRSLYFSFNGLPAGARPSIRTDDSQHILRIPIAISSIRFTVNKQEYEDAIDSYQSSTPTVDSIRMFFNKLDAVRENRPNKTVIFTISLTKNSITDLIADRVRLGYQFQVNIPEQRTFLFSKAPKTHQLTPNGFATLPDTGFTTLPGGRWIETEKSTCGRSDGYCI